MNKEKLELSTISGLVVCFWDTICAIESECIFIFQKVLTYGMDNTRTQH